MQYITPLDSAISQEQLSPEEEPQLKSNNKLLVGILSIVLIILGMIIFAKSGSQPRELINTQLDTVTVNQNSTLETFTNNLRNDQRLVDFMQSEAKMDWISFTGEVNPEGKMLLETRTIDAVSLENTWFPTTYETIETIAQVLKDQGFIYNELNYVFSDNSTSETTAWTKNDLVCLVKSPLGSDNLPAQLSCGSLGEKFYQAPELSNAEELITHLYSLFNLENQHIESVTELSITSIKTDEQLTFPATGFNITGKSDFDFLPYLQNYLGFENNGYGAEGRTEGGFVGYVGGTINQSISCVISNIDNDPDQPPVITNSISVICTDEAIW